MAERKGKVVELFADGACSGNPGPGGYGTILRYGETVREISGCEPRTTNNRMELRAIIEGLRLLKRPCRVRVVTDSNYVVKGMTLWISGWVAKNWINSEKKPVLNKDLWEELLALSRTHTVEWQWVRGHGGHKENERCDELARNAIKKCWTGKKWMESLSRMVHGIYVLTASYQDEINGMIASWVSQVSYEPPLIMVAVHPNRYSHRLIEKGCAFALHIISRERKDLLKLFKGPDPAAKFASLRWTRGITGSPLLEDSLALLDCKVMTSLNPGNHTVFIGEVVDARILSPGRPLSTLDYEGAYRGER